MRPGPAHARWLRLLCFERGVVLWLPGLWAAAALVSFAILQATKEPNQFNHTRDLRVAVGPLDVAAAPADAARAFETGLRGGLAAQRELTLVADERVRARAEAVLGKPLPADPRRWMRATRNLNLSNFVTASLAPSAGDLHAKVEVWQVADERRIHAFEARTAAAADLGRALADSVSAVLFSPRIEPIAGR